MPGLQGLAHSNWAQFVPRTSVQRAIVAGGTVAAVQVPERGERPGLGTPHRGVLRRRSGSRTWVPRGALKKVIQERHPPQGERAARLLRRASCDQRPDLESVALTGFATPKTAFSDQSGSVILAPPADSGVSVRETSCPTYSGRTRGVREPRDRPWARWPRVPSNVTNGTIRRASRQMVPLVLFLATLPRGTEQASPMELSGLCARAPRRESTVSRRSHNPCITRPIGRGALGDCSQPHDPESPLRRSWARWRRGRTCRGSSPG